MWTSLDAFSRRAACAQMPPTAILSIFLHKPMAGPHCRTGFPRGEVPRHFLGFSLYRSTGKCKKSYRACWSSELYLGFFSAKEKLVCSYKTIHDEKVKSDQKTLCTCHRISGYDSWTMHKVYLLFASRVLSYFSRVNAQQWSPRKEQAPHCTPLNREFSSLSSYSFFLPTYHSQSSVTVLCMSRASLLMKKIQLPNVMCFRGHSIHMANACLKKLKTNPRTGCIYTVFPYICAFGVFIKPVECTTSSSIGFSF